MSKLNYLKYPVGIFLLLGAILDGLVGVMFLYIALNDAGNELLKLAKTAKVMTLKEAMGSNSVAWVNVSVRISSKGNIKPLVFENSANYIWIKQEIYNTYMHEIKQKGKWIKKELEQLASDTEHFCPIEIYDSTYNLELTEKIGLKFWNDVWEVRESKFDKNTLQTIYNTDGNVIRSRIVTYLLSKQIDNLWMLAKFNNENLHILPTGEIIITKMSPQKFIELLQNDNKGSAMYILSLGLLVSALIMASIALFLLLKLN